MKNKDYYAIRCYAKVSGASRKQFEEAIALIERVPKLSANSVRAAIELKDYLTNQGFAYQHGAFTLQDILRKRGGNCLGYPFLVASILGAKGHSHQFYLQIEPQDMCAKLEVHAFKNIKTAISYASPNIAVQQELDARYRFLPLEHLVLNINGIGVETTSSENRVAMAKIQAPLTFEQALSYVYKDRAVLAIQADDAESAQVLLAEGESLWSDNRNITLLKATLARESKDVRRCESLIKKLEKQLEGIERDALLNRAMYLLTGNEEFLDEALKQYPSFASAIADKAGRIAKIDEAEARYLMAVATHCAANSQYIDLNEFKQVYNPEIRRLFKINKDL